eukprot:PhM_4_TR4223/c0_g1_i1/m.39229/K13126/PABPC; polyadenylate-binding protein
MADTQALVPTVQPEDAAPVAQSGGSVYVGDLDLSVAEAALFEHFQAIGAIISVRICRDAITRRSLGYGYVNFQAAKDAETAIEKKNCTKLGNGFIRVMPVLRDPSIRKNAVANVFIKNISPDIDTQTLHDTFLTVGNILSCKVVLDDEGKSKGYGFVQFAKEDDAKAAINSFNGKSMKDLQLYVAPFVRRNIRIQQMIASFTNVYIKNVLPNVSDDDIKNFFKKFGSVTSTCTRTDKHGRVFGFCNFASHEDAVKAIENLHERHVDGLVDTSGTLYVQRAQKKSERIHEMKSKYESSRYGGLGCGNNLYVKNFGEFDSTQLRELFCEFGDITSIYFAQDEQGVSRGFAFICYSSAEAASRALRELNGRIINDRPLYVNVAQKRDARRNMLQMQFQRRPLLGMPGLSHQWMQMAPWMGGYGRGQRGASRGRGRGAPGARRPQQGAPAAPITDVAPTQPLAITAAPASRTTTPAVIPKSATPGSVPMTPSLGPLTSEDLKKMSMEEQMNALGERLYARIHELHPEHAPKITGMLLEMDAGELLALLNNIDELKIRVKEALDVLLDFEGQP